MPDNTSSIPDINSMSPEELDAYVRQLTEELAATMTPEQARAEAERLREMRREANREAAWLTAQQLVLDEQNGEREVQRGEESGLGDSTVQFDSFPMEPGTLVLPLRGLLSEDVVVRSVPAPAVMAPKPPELMEVRVDHVAQKVHFVFKTWLRFAQLFIGDLLLTDRENLEAGAEIVVDSKDIVANPEEPPSSWRYAQRGLEWIVRPCESKT